MDLSPPLPPAHPPCRFRWRGYDVRGRRVSGTSLAADADDLRRQLLEREIVPTVLRPSRLPRSGRTRRRIPAREIALFTRQLATLVQSGLPLVTALGLIAAGQRRPALRAVTEALRRDLLEGFPLHQALARHRDHFGPLYLSLVRTGEGAGTLDRMLEAVADHLERMQQLRQRLVRSLAYPVLVLVLSTAVTAAMLWWIVPRFEDMFRSFGTELPAFTRLLIDLSHLPARIGWGALVLPLAGLGATAWRRRHPEAWPALRDHLLARLPLVARLVRLAALSRFARTTAMALQAGLPLAAVLDLVATTMDNRLYRRSVERLREGIAAGHPLSQCLGRDPLFPPVLVQMAAIGEEAGTLDAMLLRAAGQFDGEAGQVQDLLGALCEPLLMLVIGTVVGSIVLGMYLPIFQLTSVM